MSSSTTIGKIGSREEWFAAREQLLLREKEQTRLGDELAQQRRELPWVAVEKEYRFDTDDGERTLLDLFDGRSQLLVYHFMFGPSYEAGCPVNSSIADTIDGVLPHLHAARSDSALGRIRGVLRRAHPAFGDRLPVQHHRAGCVRDLVVPPPVRRVKPARSAQRCGLRCSGGGHRLVPSRSGRQEVV